MIVLRSIERIMLAAVACGLAAIPAFSQEPAGIPSNDDELRTRLNRLEADVRDLKSARHAGWVHAAGPVDTTADNAHEDQSLDGAVGSIGESGIHDLTQPSELFSQADYPTVRVTGFFQADAGWFHQGAANMAAVGDIQDGADFRRARLAAVGDVWENVSYMLEMDFGFPGRPSFMDVWLDVHDLPVFGNLRVGQFRHPIGMDGQTSVKELTFIERALPFAFLPFRQIGVMAHDYRADETMTWAVSAFRFPTDTFGGNIGDNGGYGMAARVTLLPIYADEGTRLLHLGAAYSFGDPSNDRVRYRSQPEFFISETGGADLVPVGVPTNVPPFVDTGPIATNNFNLFGLEAAAEFGSAYLQSELLYARVDQIGGSTVTFPAMYVYAGYFLTGETRAYNSKQGVFGRVEPLQPFKNGSGCGAWELAARWSYIDLNDDNIRGGRLTDLTFGVNWYLNRLTKLQFNFIHAFLDDPTLGDSDADIVALRAQVDF